MKRNFIHDTFDFFTREKFYTVLLLLTLVILGYDRWNSRGTEATPQQESQQVQQFRKAEEKLQEKLNNGEKIKEYFRKKPWVEKLLAVASFVVTGCICVGLIFDMIFLFNPTARRRFSKPPPVSHVHWKFSMLLKVIILFFASNIVISVAFLIIQRLFKFHIPDQIYPIIHTTVVEIVTLAFILRIVHQEKGTARDLGLRMPPKSYLGKEIAVGWGAYAAVLPVFLGLLFFLIAIASIFKYEPPAHPLVNVFLEEQKQSIWITVYSVFLGTVLGPILEEIFFRGFCYPILKRRYGIFLAMLMTSGFFALIHNNSFAFWPIFVLGMGLNYLYEKRGSLIASIAMHITHNTVFISYFFLAKHFVLKEGS